MEVLLAVFGFVFGSLIGSFLNVVVYRVPRGESVVHPRSRCPNCGHTLGPAELVPIVSWAAQGGKCRNCKAPISARYPAVEALTGLLFAGAALLRPELPGLFFLWAFIALLIALSFIDIDTQTLPNVLNFGGLFLGLLGAGLLGYPQAFPQALDGALMSAGLIALFAGYGGLIVNRFKDAPREAAVGEHTVHLSAMAGAWLGPAGGLVVGFLNWALNLRSKKIITLPDRASLGLALLGPLVALIPGWFVSPLDSLRGLLIGAGGLALAGMIYWWFRNPSEKVEEETQDDSGYVVAMGYGDVVLAGFLGAWLGFTHFLVGLFIAVFAGAIIGLIARRVTGENKIPFGPYLAIGGLVSFFFGAQLIQWYMSYIGAV